jgi:hypothetical protein
MNEELGFDSQKRQEISSYFSIQNGSGAHMGCYFTGTGFLLLRVRWEKQEADLSPPSSAAIKNV